MCFIVKMARYSTQNVLDMIWNDSGSDSSSESDSKSEYVESSSSSSHEEEQSDVSEEDDNDQHSDNMHIYFEPYDYFNLYIDDGLLNKFCHRNKQVC